MIKVYCLDSGDIKMWAAAEDIKRATEVMVDTYDSEMIEEGFKITPLSDEELDNEVKGEDGTKTSWRSIINQSDYEFPCIIGETE